MQEKTNRREFVARTAKWGLAAAAGVLSDRLPGDPEELQALLTPALQQYPEFRVLHSAREWTLVQHGLTAMQAFEDIRAEVEPKLNVALSVPMIQHGTEFMYPDGVGARESEFVVWFGPGHRAHRWPSSMPPGGH